MNKEFVLTFYRKGIIWLSTLFLLSSISLAQEFKKTATSGFSFLEIPVTARSASMGESSVALSDNNSESLFTNPGALGFSSLNHSTSVSFATWLADIKQYATSYSYGSDIGVFGVGLIMLDYGSMPKTVVASGQKVYEVTGTFDATALSFGLSYAKKLTDNFSFGLTLKYVEERIEVYKATNLMFDGGFLYYTGFGTLRIAGAIQNFGVNAKFINDEFKMPSILRLGLAGEIVGSHESNYQVTLIAEALHPNDNTEKLNLGCEVSWIKTIYLRGGYKFFYDEESFSFGFGVKNSSILPFSFDYSFSDYGRLGNISRVSLQFSFN